MNEILENIKDIESAIERLYIEDTNNNEALEISLDSARCLRGSFVLYMQSPEYHIYSKLLTDKQNEEAR